MSNLKKEKPSSESTSNPSSSGKNFLTTFSLCFLLGYAGLHRFYVGKKGTGILMFLTLGGLGIWWLIDTIKITVGTFTDSEGRTILSKTLLEKRKKQEKDLLKAQARKDFQEKWIEKAASLEKRGENMRAEYEKSEKDMKECEKWGIELTTKEKIMGSLNEKTLSELNKKREEHAANLAQKAEERAERKRKRELKEKQKIKRYEEKKRKELERAKKEKIKKEKEDSNAKKLSTEEVYKSYKKGKVCIGMHISVVKSLKGKKYDEKRNITKDKSIIKYKYGPYTNQRGNTQYKMEISYEDDRVVGFRDL